MARGRNLKIGKGSMFSKHRTKEVFYNQNGFKGITLEKSGFRATLYSGGGVVAKSRFVDNAEDAARDYDKLARVHSDGLPRYVNFPHGPDEQHVTSHAPSNLCARGHDLSVHGLPVTNKSNAQMNCRICNAASARAYKARKLR